MFYEVNFMKKVRDILFGTNVRAFVSSYLLFLIFGATLLKMPFSIQSGETLSWIDAIFVSVSGMSTTGLSTITVSETLTVTGQFILLFIIQFGGIGLIMLVASYWLITGKRIGFRERNMIMTDQNQSGRQGIVVFIRRVLLMIGIIELSGILIMFFYLYFTGRFGFTDSLIQSIFLTISMFTNAGFDISPDMPSLFAYSNDYFFQTLAMTLMIAGAIGFWPLSEMFAYLKAKRKKETYKFSLFTKMLVSLHLGIWIVSAVIFYILEAQSDFMITAGFFEKIYYALFMSLTTRNAGFATMNMTNTTDATQIFFGILMFIGSSPNSAGGGIRTTTLLMVVLGFMRFAKDNDQALISKKAIKDDTILRSMIVFIGALILVVFNFMLLSISQDATSNELLFEVASAFGTTGLSLGITSSLTTFGKIILIITMFIGRIGILALLMFVRPQTKRKTIVNYPEIDIIIG
jgi:Trk-type K+ transport system membrane component